MSTKKDGPAEKPDKSPAPPSSPHQPPSPPGNGRSVSDERIKRPTPAKPETGRARRGHRQDSQHERTYNEVEAELDLATQADPAVGGVDMRTKREVSRLVDGTARARLMPELARMNSHEKILRVLSFTLLRVLRRKMYPDEANAITRLCSTAQKSLDLLGLTGKEAAALADLEPGPVESDADIRARINVPTEEEGAPPVEQARAGSDASVETSAGFSTADPPRVEVSAAPGERAAEGGEGEDASLEPPA